MTNFYLYRINPRFDGFLPSKLLERSERRLLRFNWGPYVETLEPGDIILTYFTAPGCTPGVYAIGVVRSVDATTSVGNVRARLLHLSLRDRQPLYPLAGNEALFNRIRTRRRGAEVIVPHESTEEVYRLLATNRDLLRECRKWSIELPGAVRLRIRSLAEVPLIDSLTDFSRVLETSGLLGCYWIRPRQASWIARSPDWLLYVTRLFRAFKSGDMTQSTVLARGVAEQVSGHPWAGDVGAVVGVPLNEAKHDARETDRVAALASEVARELGVQHSPCLRLAGNISRRRYKNLGYTANEFAEDYIGALTVTASPVLRRCARSGRSVLLVDDVYTDGLTTRLVSGALDASLPDLRGRVRIATLGVHAKKRNMSPELIRAWE